jgi:glycosyltransferase involved in cell wall biosynthesis
VNTLFFFLTRSSGPRMVTESKPLVSVIIASYNQKHYIFDALASVFDQECDFAFEVIVADSSGDDTPALVQNRFPQTRVIALRERAYPGTARNAGLEIARGEYFAFTDTDCLVDRHWLQNLVAAHREGYPVVGGMVKNGTPWSLFGTLDYLMECSDLLTPYATTAKDHFGTGNVSFSRDIYQEYGPFANQVKGSDNMYFRKIHGSGQALYWEPKAVIWHRNRTKLKKILRNQYELGIGSAQNRRKNPVAGRIFVRYPVLIPLIPVVRIFTIGQRLLRYSPLNLLKYVVMLPLVLLCLIWYTAGFWHGFRRPQS